MTQNDEARVATLANDLTECRVRGLDRLDFDKNKYKRVLATELEPLARAYCEAKGLALHGRITQIKRLLRDGLAVYGSQGNEERARFIEGLFFEDEGSPPEHPDTLLAARVQASGLSADDFAEKRRNAFRDFAAFLITFVDGRRESHAQQEEAANREDGKNSRAAWKPYILGLLSAAMLIVIITAAWRLRGSSSKAEHAGTGGNSSVVSPSVPPYRGATNEEETGENGARTFTDPRNSGETGVKIDPYTKVRVSCKIYAPIFPSASPDGYWYRIASPPWNNRYYAVANTFLNGDSPDSRQRKVTHNTDFKIPDCR